MKTKDKNDTLSTIAEVAETYGVTQRTLRFYEQRGLLAPIRRGQTRYYDAAQKMRVEKIVKAKHLGFTIAEIAEIMEGDQPDKPMNLAVCLDKDTIERQLRYLEERRDEIVTAIAELQTALD